MPTATTTNPAVLDDFTGAPHGRLEFYGKCSRCNTDACGPRAGEKVYVLAEIDHEGPFEVGGRCLKELLDLPDALTGSAWADQRERLETDLARAATEAARYKSQVDALVQTMNELSGEIGKAQEEAADAYARGFEDGQLEATSPTPDEVEGPDPDEAA